MLRLSQEKYPRETLTSRRNSGMSYACLKPTENGVTPAAKIQRFEGLEVFLMATGECSARNSFNLLRTTSHRRCEHQ